MKNNLLFVLLIFTILSCAKDDEITNAVGKLKSIESDETYTDEKGNIVAYIDKAIFEYGANGFVSRRYHTTPDDGALHETNFYYEGDKLVKTKFSVNGKEISEYVYEYEGDLIVKHTVNDDSGISIYFYKYNSANDLIIKNRLISGKETPNQTYEYANGNVVRAHNMTSDNQIKHTYNYQHDDKNHLYSKVYSPAKLKIDLNGANNRMKDHLGYARVFEYNKDGFPTKVTEGTFETRYFYY